MNVIEEIARAVAELRAAIAVLERTEAACSAVDGPVPPTRESMTNDEFDEFARHTAAALHLLEAPGRAAAAAAKVKEVDHGPPPRTAEGVLQLPELSFGVVQLRADANGEVEYRGRKMLARPFSIVNIPTAPPSLLAMSIADGEGLAWACDADGAIWLPCLTVRGWHRRRLL